MRGYRPDRLVSVLTVVATVAFYGILAGGVLVLTAAPVLKVTASDDQLWYWGITVPAVVSDANVTVASRWGDARLSIEDARGSLRLPIAALPWSLFMLLWAHAAAVFGLILLFLHHLRRIFQRVRDGMPFDAANAVRLRWMGVLLLALAVFNGIAGLAVSLAVRTGLAEGNVRVPAAFSIDGSLVFVALVLVALAEAFRRGSELEDEQALVV